MTDTTTPELRRYYVRFRGWTDNRMDVIAENSRQALMKAAIRFDRDAYDAVDEELGCGFDSFAVETDGGAL